MTTAESADQDLPTWSSIADWYDELLVAGSGPHQTAVECLDRLTPPTAGQRLLDICCGQGVVARHLAANGAHVTGTDLAEPMIANAQRHGTPAGIEIEYRVEDAQTLSSFEHDTFDGVTCQLGLMDLPDLDACLHAVARVLKPGAWFAFVIGHPAFLVPGASQTATDDGRPAAVITDYFESRFWRSPNPGGVRRAGNYHRPLSIYLNALVDAGLHIEQAEEPIANELLAQQQPLYSRVPIFFAARTRLTAH